MIGPLAARAVIGPCFIHVVAERTLAGVRAAVESAGPHPEDEPGNAP
jgi:hypothetical protein